MGMDCACAVRKGALYGTTFPVAYDTHQVFSFEALQLNFFNRGNDREGFFASGVAVFILNEFGVKPETNQVQIFLLWCSRPD